MYNLTTNQYERVRNLVRRSPVFIGMRIEVREDEVEILEPEQLVIGFGPVLDAVAGAPAEQWPDLVDDCLKRIVGALTGGTSELDGPLEQVADRIYARLRPAEGSPTEWWTYAREIAPGLLAVLALDYPDRVSILNDDQVNRYGFDRLVDIGMQNLYKALPDSCATADGVYILNGGDYVASAVLVLGYVAEAFTGEPETPYGALAAMPDHETLIFHVLRDGAGARYAMGEIARLAALYYEDADKPISPHVHWWQPGSGWLEPVAHQSGDGSGVIGEDVVTHYSPEFAATLQELDHTRA